MGRAIYVVAAIVLLISIILHPIAARIRRRNRHVRPQGLVVVSNPADVTFELVAIHGLGAHPEQTWTSKTTAAQPGDSNTQRVHLLRDLLAPDLPSARILSFCYSSDWLIDAPVRTAREISGKLLAELTSHRSKTTKNVPIIFICHSFGGIVLKELADLEDSFSRRIMEQQNDGNNINLVSFYEQRPTIMFRWLSLGLIVDRISAHTRHSTGIGINTDHSGLNKCSRREGQQYKEIRGVIEETTKRM
ncbi:hypothetical protein B0H67DRAFT_554915 [Lasiosphaeris hirsuta]|uniref:DUF676 domain-containing protein n=1 Tax=Lasiosphaeris hirsuta TaxID=260670 RepID=A0AA40A7Y7_9PEZI|nr:hypothetical protein B0H67DRAFT_554915 [Lasiosphaeris hirsuta]